MKFARRGGQSPPVSPPRYAAEAEWNFEAPADRSALRECRDPRRRNESSQTELEVRLDPFDQSAALGRWAEPLSGKI